MKLQKWFRILYHVHLNFKNSIKINFIVTTLGCYSGWGKMVVERYGYGFDGAHGGGTTVMVKEWWNIRVDADYKGGGLWLWRKRWWLKIWWLIGFWQRKIQNTEQRLHNCGDCSGSSDNNRGGCDYEWSSSGGDW